MAVRESDDEGIVEKKDVIPGNYQIIINNKEEKDG
jgi:hypothetical protein